MLGIVYNSLMNFRRRYSRKTIPHERVKKMVDAFTDAAGPSLRLMMDMMSSIPNVALTIKNADGRIMHTNRFNAEISGWRSPDDLIGYTSEELYPPDQAAVYANRDREVMQTGVPIVERVYGFVADRSDNLNCVTVRPVISTDGKRIGTATIYWRAQKKMAAANWYAPIRNAILHLNRHYTENPSIERLASIANYSPARFRRLFKEVTHLSPSDYVKNVRINAAKTLLATTGSRISDIAADIGYFDHSHFIRTFKALTGMTPAKYRRSCLTGKTS